MLECLIIVVLFSSLRNESKIPTLKPKTIKNISNFQMKLNDNGFPLQVKEVVHANDPLHAVSKGCLIASKALT